MARTYWVLKVRTESGDEHGFILVSDNRPSNKAVHNYLKPMFPDEYENGDHIGFELYQAKPHVIKE